MKLTFATVGKPRASWAKDALDHYARFLSKYSDVEWLWARAVAGADSREAIDTETERLLQLVKGKPGFKIACDKHGVALSSVDLAKRLQEETDRHSGRAIIVIGGPWGFDERVRMWADLVWSFGPMTLAHELALVVAVEQTARALSILRGDSYHK
jgi:23S rRNA (pseudouridine1915-N3)-methyltransferase